ncbi:MAG: niacin permease NiaP [Promethearchaeota archaeon]
MTEEATDSNGGARRPRAYWLFFLFAMFLNEIWDTYNTTYPDAIVSEVRAFYGVTTAQYAWYLGWFSLGTYFVFVAQVLVDRVGRRPMLVAVFAGYGVANLMLNFAPTIQAYSAAMFLLYTCFSSDVWTIMVGEEAPPGKRAKYTSLVLVVGAAAVLPVSLGRAYLIPAFGWRAMTWFGLAALPLSLLLLKVKETPVYEELKEKKERGDASDAPLRLGAVLSQPFRETYRWPFLVLLLGSFALGVNYVFVKLGEDFLSNQRGFSDVDVGLVTVVVAVAAISGFVLTGFLGDRAGRKPTFFLFSGLLPVGLALLAHGNKPAIFVGILLAWMSFWGLGMLLRLVTIETFPTNARGAATGWRTLAFAAGTSTGAFLTSLVEPVLGLAATFLAYALAFVAYVPLFAIVVRETKGTSLSEA